ncbi:hypothetical protein ACQKO6_04000 [Pseudomonas monteilii]
MKRKNAIIYAALATIMTPAFADPSKNLQSLEVSRVVQAFETSISNDISGKLTIAKNIDSQSEAYQKVNDLINARYTYPQGFQIDEQRDLLYLLRYSNGHPARGIIEKYQWSTGALLSTYIINEPQASISESIVIEHTKEGDLAYIRSDNQLVRYQLIEPNEAFGSTRKLDTLYENVAQSFYKRNNYWYLEKYKTTPDHIGQSRGEYVILDENFNHVRDVSFLPLYAGYRESEKFNIPKHQGFAVLNDGYVMSMGGYWSDKTGTTPYHYYGINLFNSDGSIKSSNYVSPATLFSELSRLGIHAYRNENEGIQVMKDGSLMVLQVVQTKEHRNSRLLFINFSLASQKQ